MKLLLRVMGRVIGKPNCHLDSIKYYFNQVHIDVLLLLLFLFYLDNHGEWNLECKYSRVCSLK